MSFTAAPTLPSLAYNATNVSPIARLSQLVSPSLRALLPRQNGECVYEVSTQPRGVSHLLFITTTQHCALPEPSDAITQPNGHQPSTPLTTTAFPSTTFIQPQESANAAPPASKIANYIGGTGSSPPQKSWSSTPRGIAVMSIVLILPTIVVVVLYWFFIRRSRKRREAVYSTELAILTTLAAPALPAEQAQPPRLADKSALPPASTYGVLDPPPPNNGVPFPPPPNSGVLPSPSPNNGVPPSPRRKRDARVTNATNKITKNQVRFHPNGGLSVKQTTSRLHSQHGKHDSGLGEDHELARRSPQWPHERAYRSPPPSPTRGRATQGRCELPGEPDFTDYRRAAFNAETINALHQQRIRREWSPERGLPTDPSLARARSAGFGREVPGGYPPSPPPAAREAPLSPDNVRGERRFMEWGFHLAGRVS